MVHVDWVMKDYNNWWTNPSSFLPASHRSTPTYGIKEIKIVLMSDSPRYRFYLRSPSKPGKDFYSTITSTPTPTPTPTLPNLRIINCFFFIHFFIYLHSIYIPFLIGESYNFIYSNSSAPLSLHQNSSVTSSYCILVVPPHNLSLRPRFPPTAFASSYLDIRRLIKKPHQKISTPF
jgi:hypothetical protein